MPNFAKDVSHPRSIDRIAEELGETYYIKDDADKDLKEYRREFFEAATLAKEAEGLAQKVAQAPETITDSVEAREYVERYNSGWRIVKVAEDEVSFVLEEDPNFKGHTKVIEIEGGVTDREGNEHPGFVITKTVRQGPTMLDDERLAKENQELYHQVTEVVNYDMLYMALMSVLQDEDMVQAEIESYNLDRVPKNPDELTVQQTEDIKPYLYEGPKTLALNVRYAKEEELGEG